MNHHTTISEDGIEWISRAGRPYGDKASMAQYLGTTDDGACAKLLRLYVRKTKHGARTIWDKRDLDTKTGVLCND